MLVAPNLALQAQQKVQLHVRPYCWDPRLLGTWYRRGRHGEKQQFNAYADGYTSFAYFDPVEAGGTAGAAISGQAHPPCNYDESTTAPTPHLPPGVLFADVGIDTNHGGYPQILDHGRFLDFLEIEGKSIYPRERLFERAFEPPPIDWKRRAKGGGYVWDFAHVCPPNARRILDPMLSATWVRWKAWVNHDFHERYIRLGMDGATHKMLWADGPLDAPMIPTDYCTPNDHTLVLGIPGPRGTTIPKAYDLMIEDSLSNLFINGYEAFQR